MGHSRVWSITDGYSTGTTWSMESGVNDGYPYLSWAKAVDQSLPVELASFKLSSAQGVVNLTWVTESEIENQGFIIERSLADSKSWEAIASFSHSKDLVGQGSTSEQTHYAYTDAKVEVGATYSYRLVDVDYKGQQTTHAAQEITVILNDEDVLPGRMTLHPAYPNPFNPIVSLSITLAHASTDLRFEIYDLQGGLVRTLSQGAHEAGSYDFSWNGLDNHNQQVASGVYLVRLAGENQVAMQRVTLIR